MHRMCHQRFVLFLGVRRTGGELNPALQRGKRLSGLVQALRQFREALVIRIHCGPRLLRRQCPISLVVSDHVTDAASCTQQLCRETAVDLVADVFHVDVD